MGGHREMMKVTLAESLRSLMMKKVFEKITIKQICDEAGVIRATFYNYFEDKYDCLNWIVYHDAGLDRYETENYARTQEVSREVLETIYENREFYRRAYEVTGQNSFENMIRENMKLTLEKYFAEYRVPQHLEKYSDELLASYYGEILAFHIKRMVMAKDGSQTPEETRKMIFDLARYAFIDFVGDRNQ